MLQNFAQRLWPIRVKRHSKAHESEDTVVSYQIAYSKQQQGNSLAVLLVNTWNSLLDVIVSASSLNFFKRRPDRVWKNEEMQTDLKASLTSDEEVFRSDQDNDPPREDQTDDGTTAKLNIVHNSGGHAVGASGRTPRKGGQRKTRPGNNGNEACLSRKPSWEKKTDGTKEKLPSNSGHLH